MMMSCGHVLVFFWHVLAFYVDLQAWGPLGCRQMGVAAPYAVPWRKFQITVQVILHHVPLPSGKRLQQTMEHHHVFNG